MSSKLNNVHGPEKPEPKILKDTFDEKRLAALRAYAEQMGPEHVAAMEHDLNRPLTDDDRRQLKESDEIADIIIKSNKKARRWLVLMLVAMLAVITFAIVKAIADVETEKDEKETYSLSEANPAQKIQGEAVVELAEAMNIPEAWSIRDEPELRMNGGEDDAYASYDASFTPPDELTVEQFEEWFNGIDRIKASDESACSVDRDRSYVECEANFTAKDGAGSINYDEPRQTVEIGYYPKKEGSSDPGAVFMDVYSSN